MEKAKTERTSEGLYEVHCTICGDRLGYYDMGSRGRGIRCGRCKRALKFAVQDGETIVWCKQEKG